MGLAAGVGLAGAYGLAMLGTYRAADAREAGHVVAMVLYGVVGALGVLIVAGGLVGGLLIVIGGK